MQEKKVVPSTLFHKEGPLVGGGVKREGTPPFFYKSRGVEARILSTIEGEPQYKL